MRQDVKDPFQTRVKLLYSTKGLYVLMDAADKKLTAEVALGAQHVRRLQSSSPSIRGSPVASIGWHGNIRRRRLQTALEWRATKIAFPA